MKKILALVLLVFSLIMLALPACGSIGLGTRAMGMGGAFTAVADDESAFYWNPAGITQVRFASIMFGAGAQGEDLDFIKDTIDKISDLEKLNPEEFKMGRGYLNLGLLGGLTTRFVGVNFYSETSIDASRDALTTLNVNASSFNYGTVTIAGKFREKIAVGLNLKKVVAGTGEGKVEGSTNNYTQYLEGDGFAYDIGILYQINEQVRWGFIVRNLGGEIDCDGEKKTFSGGGETIDKIYGKTVNLPRDYAVGVSYRPFKNTLLACDIQKCDARQFTPDQTRFRIGFEQTALWNIIAFRLGVYTNKSEPLALTAGLGLNLGPLEIGVAGIREEFNDKKADMAVVTVGIRF